MSEPPNPNLYPIILPWMWNSPIPHQPTNDGDGDSWEVRAFKEDTSSVTGTTWPPRSYTCTFCLREFRSAQALGGHMNVHRRDRARLQLPPPPTPMQLGFFENRTGFCLVCQQLLLGTNAQPLVHEAELSCLQKHKQAMEFGIDHIGEEDDKGEAQASQVELDLELRLGN